ncbi:hypothetical protein [Aristophania vespae]|uniref:hypothetical protein n=1 Tax=Aristophania vespae TaxID=2697033 RepID=UPI0023519EF3|nr:hypothetical protein [Aristophania vespae]UMM63154.1 hypothetical protein DM15PD_01090 [Aristophania vespae]
MTETRNRYFVCSSPETNIVQGFYSVPSSAPVTNPDFHEITQDDYEHYLTQPGAIWKDGSLLAYTPPAPPLAEQAQDALSRIQAQIPSLFVMGQQFGEKTKAYISALNAIIDGIDTTSAALPAQPEKLTD